MLKQNLENFTLNFKEKNVRSEVIKNYLKEYLQIIILDFLYSAKYKGLIFTRGSCLRVCYGLNIFYLKQDIENLFESKNFVDEFIKNFNALYERYKREYLRLSINGLAVNLTKE